MSGARAAAPADKESDRGRVATAKVQRYWAGKRPDAVPEDAEEGPAAMFGQDTASAVKRTPVAAAVVVKKADPRLARLSRTNVAEARDEGIRRHRREVHAAEVVARAPLEDDSDEDAATALQEDDRAAGRSKAHQGELEGGDAGAAPDDEEQIEAERQRRRQRALERQQAERAAAALQKAKDSSSELESEEDSEYESESEDEEEGRLAKPVFVAKSDRDTIAEKQRLLLEEQQRWEADQKRKEERKKETSQLVAAIVDSENQAARNRGDGPTNNPSDIDTSDESDDDDAERAFLGWQRRELARIKREAAMKDAREREALEREKLASMSEAERAAYAARHAQESKVPKAKLKFLQKYYHKGAFFQSAPDDMRGTVGGEDIFRRDFSGATGEDKFDKTALPAVMQVRNFGRAGRTKWTHLAAEDTTAQQPQNLYADDVTDVFAGIKKKMEHKGAGLQQAFEKPKNTRT